MILTGLLAGLAGYVAGPVAALLLVGLVRLVITLPRGFAILGRAWRG